MRSVSFTTGAETIEVELIDHDFLREVYEMSNSYRHHYRTPLREAYMSPLGYLQTLALLTEISRWTAPPIGLVDEFSLYGVRIIPTVNGFRIHGAAIIAEAKTQRERIRRTQQFAEKIQRACTGLAGRVITEPLTYEPEPAKKVIH